MTETETELDIFNVYNLPTHNSERYRVSSDLQDSQHSSTNQFKANEHEFFSAMASDFGKIFHYISLFHFYLATEKRHVSDVICCASTKDGGLNLVT